MEYFLVMYDSRVVIYERKMFIRLATGLSPRLPPNIIRVLSTDRSNGPE